MLLCCYAAGRDKNQWCGLCCQQHGTGKPTGHKAGRLLFIRPGTGKTASGKPIPQQVIERSDGDRHSFSLADRGAYTGVTASWLHTKEPKPKKPKKVKIQRKVLLHQGPQPTHPKAKKTTKVPEAREGIAKRLKNDYSRSPDMWQRSIAGCYQNNVAWLYHAVRAGSVVV